MSAQDQPSDAKAKEASRIERELYAKERQAEYRAANRTMNRKERRKLRAEINKIERGDYT